MRKFKVNYKVNTIKLAECQFNNFKEDWNAIIEFLSLIMEIPKSLAETIYTMFNLNDETIVFEEYSISKEANIMSIYFNEETPCLEENIDKE